MFRKVLIANRGEIAVRVMRTLREMGIAGVAVYSDADRTSLHVRMADEAERIGPPPSADSYLRIDRIIDAARKHGAEAIHPGYGFLSENADFAAACAEAGLVFIGPSADSIRRMGSKTAARRTAIAAGAPVVPGTDHGVTLDEAVEFGRGHGYPILLKAVAGGGGKGMRVVDRESDLASALRDASSEAQRAFRSGEVYVEKLIDQPRHIEIQVLGDQHGNMVHLGERECSIQRRHQKVIEECPSPLVALHPEMREAMGQAAIHAARAAAYYNAGTVEFLVDRDRRFYFLEMNTRLQVEHPVTELVTGLDLVRLQVEIAAGARLPFAQEDVAWRGCAIECRIYAEDPYNNFLPYPGRLTRLSRPLGPGIRLDGCVYNGWTVPMEYDPLLAKLAVWAGTRGEAAGRMVRALREYDVGGIRTNIGFFRQILEDPEFRSGRLHTGFIDDFFGRHQAPQPPRDLAAVAALAAALHATRPSPGAPASRKRTCRSLPMARRRPKRAAAMKLSLTINGAEDTIEILAPAPDCRFRIGGEDVRDAQVEAPEPCVYSVLMDGRSYDARVEQTAAGAVVVVIDGYRFEVEVRDPRRWTPKPAGRGADGAQSLTAPMPGKVVRVLVAACDAVEAGQGVVVVEAMKMQNEIKAPRAGRVIAIPAKEGATVAAGDVLATIE